MARGRWLDQLGRAVIVVFAIVVELAVWDGAQRLRSGGLLPYAVVPVVTIIIHATLLLRWRRPRTIFALEWGFAVTATLVLPDFQPFVGLLVALHAVASRLPPRESAVWLVTVLVPFGFQSSSAAAFGEGGDPTRRFVLFVILWALIGLVVWGVGRLAYTSAQRAWRLRELQAEESEEAVRAERLRLARELHDTVSHAVTGMLLQAAGARVLLRPTDERLSSTLTAIETTGVQAMSELHRLLGLLHAVDPDTEEPPPSRSPTVADIGDLVELARSAGREIELITDGVPGELDPSVATAAYRVVQEGLTNSAKHSGPAAAVKVELRWTAARLMIIVTDRRQGNPMSVDKVVALSSGRGLAGLRERVTLVGGSLDSEPEIGGFRLLARLPRPQGGAAP